jgi:hypothetical protein
MPRVAGWPGAQAFAGRDGVWIADLASPDEVGTLPQAEEEDDMSTPAAIFNWSAGGAAGDMGQSITGEWISMQGFRHISFDFSWTGTNTPIGVLAFEISNDGTTPFNFPGTFSPAIVQPSGPAGTQICDALVTDAAYIRAKYTRTSGGATAVITGRHQRKA